MHRKENPARANAQDSLALVDAARYGQIDAMKLLLTQKENPARANAQDSKALVSATQCNRIEVMRLLLIFYDRFGYEIPKQLESSKGIKKIIAEESAKSILATSGYIHQCEREFNLNIPNVIPPMVIQYQSTLFNKIDASDLMECANKKPHATKSELINETLSKIYMKA